MRTRIISIVLLLATIEVSGQTSGLSKEAQEAMDFHNKVRKAVGAPPLQWSEDLSAFAQAWANELARRGCRIRHRPTSGEWAQKYGENIFSGWGGEYTSLDASQSWYSEISNFRYGRLSESNWRPAGHYTQMVWKNTTQMGVGKAVCGNGGVIIVANYDPPGNYLGQYPY